MVSVYRLLFTGSWSYGSCGCVGTTIWLSHVDSKETFEEKVWWELHKNAMTCFEQILQTTNRKEAAVRKLFSYLRTHPGKMNKKSKKKALLKKSGWTWKWRSSLDFHTLLAHVQKVAFLCSVMTLSAPRRTCPNPWREWIKGRGAISMT